MKILIDNKMKIYNLDDKTEHMIEYCTLESILKKIGELINM